MRISEDQMFGLLRGRGARSLEKPPRPDKAAWKRLFTGVATAEEKAQIQAWNYWHRQQRAKSMPAFRQVLEIVPHYLGGVYELQSPHSEVWTLAIADDGGGATTKWGHEPFAVAYGTGGEDRMYLSPRSGQLVNGIKTGRHLNVFPGWPAAVRATMRFDEDYTPVLGGPRASEMVVWSGPTKRRR